MQWLFFILKAIISLAKFLFIDGLELFVVNCQCTPILLAADYFSSLKALCSACNASTHKLLKSYDIILSLYSFPTVQNFGKLSTLELIVLRLFGTINRMDLSAN